MIVNIHFVLTQDLSSPSGFGRYLPWAKELVRLGHKVRISTTHSNYKSLSAKKCIQDGVEVEYVAQMHVYKEGTKKIYFSIHELIWKVLISTIQLCLSVFKYPSAVLIVGKPHPMNSLAGLLGSLRWSCPLIIDVDDDEEHSGNFKYLWQKKIIGWTQKNVPKMANLVTTNTIYMKRRLMSYGIPRERIVYLPNGIQATQDISLPKERILYLREKLKLGNKKVVLFLGSISLINHPINLLVEAFEILRQAYPSVVLLLVGGGESIDEVKKLLSDKGLEKDVYLVGKVPPEKVREYYALADVSVDPVYDDIAARGRCPLKLFESWIYGVPFVTGDVGDRRVLAGTPPAIYLCKSGDPHALATGILEILADESISRSLVSLGKERVKNFYWDRLVLEFEKHLRSFAIR